ncbi:MAG: hypothetical protein AB4042_21965 [Leptolyngbyaceae cyanobacterium]
MFNKTFRCTLAASTLLLAASVLVAPMAKAESDNDDVQGTLGATTLVNYEGTSFALDAINGHTGQDFGSVTFQSNDNDGWTLTVDSGNDGDLSDGTNDISYSPLTAAWDGTVPTGVTLTSSLDVTGLAVTVADATQLACSEAGGCTVNLTADILSTDIDGKPAGVYSDTLTFNFTAK